MLGIQKAKNTLEKLVKVQRLTNGINWQTNKTYFPNNFINCAKLTQNNVDVVDADLLILIRPLMGIEPYQGITYPITKIIRHIDDKQINRPFLATIVFTYTLTGDNNAQIQDISTLFLHQFTHILGFNKTIFNNLGLISKQETKNRMNIATKIKLFFTGTKALTEARNYFDYPSLPGIELDESNGKEINDGSSIHWSERILLGDYMTTRLYFTEQAISEITLSALEDLGWYKVNYYTGGLMRFGKNKGSAFFNYDCVEGVTGVSGVKTNFSNEFCSNIYEGENNNFGTCSSGRQSMSFCYNTYYKGDIDYEYARSNINTNKGFSESKLIEYCPFSRSIVKNNSETETFNYNGNCKIGSSAYGWINNYIEEDFSETSFCFHSSLVNKNNKTQNRAHVKNVIRPTCYNISCSARSLTIHLGNEFFVCPRAGGIIEIEDNSYSDYTGFLFCPDYNLICTGKYICNNLFDCVDKSSTPKNLTNDYKPNVNVSIEVTTNIDTLISETHITKTGMYELSEDGECPQYCQQCNIYKQCKICATGYKNYIGTKENDYEEIKCSNTTPADGYYNFTDTNQNKYFYKCIDHCKLCFNNTKNQCDQCYPTHYINAPPGNRGNCTDRITGCIKYDNTSGENRTDNGGGLSYMECLQCNNLADYYCLNGNRSICHHKPYINKDLYGPIETGDNPCLMLCSERFSNCEACNLTSCTRCYDQSDDINHYGICLKKIDNCLRLDLYKNTSECLICDATNKYYCIEENRTYCQYISAADIISYSKMDTSDNSCVKLCNKTWNDTCLECNSSGCTKCQDGFFVYKGYCYENMKGCIDNTFNNEVEKIKECNKCDEEKSFYCLNLNRTECYYLQNPNIIKTKTYFKFANVSYPCYAPCELFTPHCIECDSYNCFKCQDPFVPNRRKTKCLENGKEFDEDEPCEVVIHQKNDNLNESMNFNDTVDDYYSELDNINKVEHFVGKDYTMTIYVNPSCTAGLLKEGYYQINTNELNRTIIEETGNDLNLIGIYINRNHRSYLSFYDLDERVYIDLENNCRTCMQKKYIMTHNLFTVLSEVIGAKFADFVIEKNLDIFSEDSAIFTDTCENLTLYDIDVPIHLRKNLLYFHEYLESIMCRDVTCEFVEFDFNSKTSTCNCKMTKKFEDIFNSPKFEFVPYNIESEAKGFSEAVKVIKCLNEGIKWKNFKINAAAIICVVIFVLQVIFYVAYGCFGKPLANVPNLPSTLANPPKGDSRTKIYLFSDWVLNLPNNNRKEDLNSGEEEKVIQPRDDSGDQIMEEEKSLNNDFFSDISIDTNAGGLFGENKTNRSLRANEKNKRFLILLGNKSKKKVSVENSIKQDIESDSDSVPFGKFRRNEVYSLGGNYWLFLSIKQHIINFFSEIKYCNMTESYIPLTLRLIRSLFLFLLSLIMAILWLDQKYFEEKWNHFNEKYSLLSDTEEKIDIPLSERIAYALSHTIAHVIVNLIVLIFADFIIGIVFFKIREDVEKLLEKSKLSKIQDFVLKTRKYNNVFYALNFILVVIFFLSLAGFGVTYPGGVTDCMTSGIFAIFILQIVPFIWALILALLRHYGMKKKNKCMTSFSEYFLY